MRYDTKGNHGDGKVHGVRILHSGMDWRFFGFFIYPYLY